MLHKCYIYIYMYIDIIYYNIYIYKSQEFARKYYTFITNDMAYH